MQKMLHALVTGRLGALLRSDARHPARSASVHKAPKRRLAVIFTMVALLCPMTANVAAQQVASPDTLTAKPAVRVARLIRELGSESYGERREADEALAAMGQAARAQLEEAATDADPEIRLRAKNLLRRLKVLDLWSPSHVDYQAMEVPVSQAVAVLAEQSGNHLMTGDQYSTVRDVSIEFDCRGLTFWEALDKLCALSGNRVRPHDARQPGLVVMSGDSGEYPVAYSGPVRAQIKSARRVFSEELDYLDGESELTHTFQFTLQMMWEDRVKLVAYRAMPDLVVARDETGAELVDLQSTGGGWNLAADSTRQVPMTLRLDPPSIKSRRLDMLKLKWGLIAVGDMATLEVTDLNSAEPHFQGDLDLVVEAIEFSEGQGSGSRVELTLLINRDLVIPEPQDVVFRENEIELLDAEGNAFRQQVETNTLAADGARMKIRFVGASENSRPVRLRFTYPRIRTQTDLEIIFRDVPLPVAEPD